MITRRFTKEGSSSYKIKSKDGKTISTKKDELSAICDHMNIQVDNPLNILSQGVSVALIDHLPSSLYLRTEDSARQFLNSSHPKEKYEVLAILLKTIANVTFFSKFSTLR